MTKLTKRRLLAGIPLAGAALIGASFWKILSDMQSGTFDPRAIQTNARGHRVPNFSLPGLPGLGAGFDRAEIEAAKHPVLVNFFASWCLPCLAEMAALRQIAHQITIWGIAYKNKPEDASHFVLRNGSPYGRTASDLSGRTALEWGITGVPESFLVLPGGLIIWHGAQPLSEEIFHQNVQPLTSQS